MEYEQPIAAESQTGQALPELTRDAFPTAPQPPSHNNAPPRVRPAPRRRRRSPWRYVGLLAAGLCCYALLIMLAALAWGYVAYYQQGDVAGERLLPIVIFLGAIFISSCLVTALARGGAIFPALLLTVLANILSLLIVDMPLPQLSGILLKLSLSLACAVAGFTVIKLLIVNGRRRRAARGKAA